jgi:hypothetical protein
MPFFANAAYLKNVSRFWIWVVLIIPSTSLAFVFYRVWQRRERQRKVGSDARKRDLQVQSSNSAIDTLTDDPHTGIHHKSSHHSAWNVLWLVFFLRPRGFSFSPTFQETDAESLHRQIPRPGSRSALTFPLAMGSFPETDIISSYLCCDACSTHLVRLGRSPLDEEIVGSYPLLRRGQDENRTT